MYPKINRYPLVLLLISLSLTMPHALPTLTAGQPLAVRYTKMINADEGWGVVNAGDDSDYIMRTKDGGKTWFDVTPAKFTLTDATVDLNSHEFFPDGKHAWLTSTDEHGSWIWSTQDGGNTWAQAKLLEPQGSPVLLSFADEKHGWVLLSGCCAAGNDPAQIYRTTDGGRSWILTADSLGFGGKIGGLSTPYHTGIAFANAYEGWMTFATISGEGGIAHTTNAGRSWRNAKLPVPPTEKTLQGCDMTSPTIFSPTELLFVANCHQGDYENRNLIYLFATKNDGKMWTITPIAVADVVAMSMAFNPPLVYMISPSVGWLVTGKVGDVTTADFALYQTTDGGQNWTKLARLPPELNSNVLFCDNYTLCIFDFIDSQTGWSLTQSGDLLQTSDGGKTWNALHPRLAAQA